MKYGTMYTTYDPLTSFTADITSARLVIAQIPDEVCCQNVCSDKVLISTALLPG